MNCLLYRSRSTTVTPQLLLFFVGTFAQPPILAVIDDKGQPIICEIWPGNTADVTTLLPVVERLNERFKIDRVCIVADRGMISTNTTAALQAPDNRPPCILWVRVRRVNQVADRVLAHPVSYRQVHP